LVTDDSETGPLDPPPVPDPPPPLPPEPLETLVRTWLTRNGVELTGTTHVSVNCCSAPA
jgi:hypothetical protein